MARALMGHVGTPTQSALAHEVMRLRRRVAELEAELATERARVVDVALDEVSLDGSGLQDLDLHHELLTGSAQPALA